MFTYCISCIRIGASVEQCPHNSRVTKHGSEEEGRPAILVLSYENVIYENRVR